MVKKLDLSTSRKADPYGDFTRNYRQSSNVEDRRVSSAAEVGRELMGHHRYTIPERDPGRTPSDPRNTRGTGTANQSGGATSQSTGRADSFGTSTDDATAGAAGLMMRPDQSRKSDPEEALRRTGNR